MGETKGWDRPARSSSYYNRYHDEPSSRPLLRHQPCTTRSGIALRRTNHTTQSTPNPTRWRAQQGTLFRPAILPPTQQVETCHGRSIHRLSLASSAADADRPRQTASPSLVTTTSHIEPIEPNRARHRLFRDKASYIRMTPVTRKQEKNNKTPPSLASHDPPPIPPDRHRTEHTHTQPRKKNTKKRCSCPQLSHTINLARIAFSLPLSHRHRLSLSLSRARVQAFLQRVQKRTETAGRMT